ncbi:iron-containing alcohol dehydrogenase [Acetobacterium tundrae]|uniref:Iron-containing alcohol dehydrogenase n=1 Tax=Acetobacterium tundrae TaxID=132932 RepID=A0ABR6WIP2_9FIRM|nr:iron-containing alcohol dehydrogenase [Acetobacterium tundrae]MBC3796350.1 iron-containing alcohol dehydrogenase [Acetobacterium tundrae]
MVRRYTQLCPVAFGTGAVSTTGEVGKELGLKKVLVVTDENIEQLGHSQKVIDSLTEAGIQTVLFNRCEMDAPDYTVQAGADLAKNEGVDGIIGIGGGSVLDSAKGISVLATNNITVAELLDCSKKMMPVENPPLKIILIPTTSGTGSESTIIAVISDTKNHEKTGTMAPPTFAIVDPELALTMPKEVTVYTGMDAFSHACEALTSIQPNPHSDILCYDSIERITKWLPIAAKDLNNLEARENLALASNNAGIAFNDAMVHLGHATAHSMGAAFHIPHGICCALVTPVMLELTASVYPEKVKKIGEIMGLTINSSDSKEIGLQVADNIRQFMKQLDIPTLKDLEISKEQIGSCTNYVANEGLRFLCPVQVTEEQISELLGQIYDGYQ